VERLIFNSSVSISNGHMDSNKEQPLSVLGQRIVALEDALRRIAMLPRRDGLFTARRIAIAALAGDALPAGSGGPSLGDPTYYAKARRGLERNWSNCCAYCGKSGEVEALEIEHALPVSRGGSDAPGNLLLACSSCNQRKGTQTLEEFGFGDLLLKLIGQTFASA
jgi:hypothetical protein